MKYLDSLSAFRRAKVAVCRRFHLENKEKKILKSDNRPEKYFFKVFKKQKEVLQFFFNFLLQYPPQYFQLQKWILCLF